MIIIGEKINGARTAVAKAIIARDVGYIQDLAIKQTNAGANYLDVNAGVNPDSEPDVLTWLIETIQAVSNVPLCIDSANPQAIAVSIAHVKHTPMINSVSGEKKLLDGILPMVEQHGCPVIMLAMDDRSVPKTSEERMIIVRYLVEEARRLGISDELLYIDPLVTAIATDVEAGKTTLSTIKAIHSQFPKAHIVSGLSNISFGLPARSLINSVFVTLAMESGLDSAILDPTDTKLMSVILATELVLGKDKRCLNYNRAFRTGKLGV